VKRLLLAIIPGDENWLWRRIACLGSTAELLRCIDMATQKGDSGTVGQLVIGLGVALGAYVGGSVTDDHLKRKSESENAT
jgi:predicted MFS family arabinose efflux permease